MTIAAAVSGGMDSLMALALLRDEGHDVIAVHAHFLPPDERQRAVAAALDAQCRALGVPFHAVDLSRAFRERVIEPFMAAYAAGLTPNPCAGCNRDMKFGLLFDEAARLGADRIATGHYARLDGGLRRGADPAKDQSYFLTLTPRQSLDRAVFPLGEWRKAELPAALAARGLAVPLPSESQEVCFIPDDDYRAFLLAQGADLPGEGPVRLADGREIGRHKGLWRHTIGQRKGLGIPWSEPLYVLDKLAEKNDLVVGPKSALDSHECRARGVNLLVAPGLWPDTVLAQTCYRQKARPARAVLEADGTLALRFAAPVPRPTPGQVAAIYDETGLALAGATIV
ncbi:MAG: tRNA 2-thiouridine(34) synthase MnmA [Thermodesulfobacteriota bacterium]